MNIERNGHNAYSIFHWCLGPISLALEGKFHIYNH
uniref:Uncharacterized protein n=1 Tax=Rhizophora mucronata TaxID=61149 RepID=A0A2P2LDX7_RHIMU